MLHTFGGPDATFDHRVQLGQLSQLVSSQAAKASLAEFYTGLPIELHQIDPSGSGRGVETL